MERIGKNAMINEKTMKEIGENAIKHFKKYPFIVGSETPEKLSQHASHDGVVHLKYIPNPKQSKSEQYLETLHDINKEYADAIKGEIIAEFIEVLSNFNIRHAVNSASDTFDFSDAENVYEDIKNYLSTKKPDFLIMNPMVLALIQSAGASEYKRASKKDANIEYGPEFSHVGYFKEDEKKTSIFVHVFGKEDAIIPYNEDDIVYNIGTIKTYSVKEFDIESDKKVSAVHIEIPFVVYCNKELINV
jgi:hypothetical protein